MSKYIGIILISHLCFNLFAQNVIEGKWNVKAGGSMINVYNGFSVINVRCISPRFRWAQDDWTAEEEKHPEKYKRARITLEVLYRPAFDFFGTSINIQYSFIKYKKITVEAYGGLKFLIATPPDYIINPYSSSTKKDIWYINPGLIFQLDLGVIGPFADIGYDGILTVGTEMDIAKLYKKIRRNFIAPYLNEN